MCVILVCPPEVRPGSQILEACQRCNPHGAGVAWRERDRVHWMKNLDAEEVGQLLPQLDGEVVIHFRWASVGGVDARLCHPFPVDGAAELGLSGSAKKLLFHNGTWAEWSSTIKYLRGAGCVPKGPVSDSRAMALLIHHLKGTEILKTTPGRFVLFDGKRTQLFGNWTKWGGMQCSNTNFLYELERVVRAQTRKKDLDQLELWMAQLPAEGGAR